jgi:phage gpG-like protein
MAKRSGPTFIQRSRRVAPAEKAAFHDTDGAGRVHRPFLGITSEDETAIVDRFAAGLDRLLKEQS